MEAQGGGIIFTELEGEKEENKYVFRNYFERELSKLQEFPSQGSCIAWLFEEI